MATPGPLLKLTNVSKHFDTAEAAGALPVLRDISLEISAGESVAIVGPSGSGKSTLLNLVGALDRPTAGEISVDGLLLGEASESQRVRHRRSRTTR